MPKNGVISTALTLTHRPIPQEITFLSRKEIETRVVSMLSKRGITRGPNIDLATLK